MIETLDQSRPIKSQGAKGGRPAVPLFAIGSRWIVNFGFSTYTVVIISILNDRLAWKAEKGELKQVETVTEFLNPSYRCAMPLPPLPPPWWQRLLGLANIPDQATAKGKL